MPERLGSFDAAIRSSMGSSIDAGWNSAARQALQRGSLPTCRLRQPHAELRRRAPHRTSRARPRTPGFTVSCRDRDTSLAHDPLPRPDVADQRHQAHHRGRRTPTASSPPCAEEPRRLPRRAQQPSRPPRTPSRHVPRNQKRSGAPPAGASEHESQIASTKRLLTSSGSAPPPGRTPGVYGPTPQATASAPTLTPGACDAVSSTPVRSDRWTIRVRACRWNQPATPSSCAEHGHRPEAPTSPSHYAADLARTGDGAASPPPRRRPLLVPAPTPPTPSVSARVVRASPPRPP